ncbi:triose-phosphate isomerase [Candidatus Pandoraea novymonadis]|uniref:Triosephosphate isomerase n=1 Tax=Candidatus Pandoraea novymonadis TaxID=1808959 RepID=A0ABX5FDV2_9BURK|nr:triose-phosphate isomerase [Candidatus Pandoraea novymonadis]PSB91844.1 Triosephosphate isomerase [Candidatus Pandoraea novymonadis]
MAKAVMVQSTALGRSAGQLVIGNWKLHGSLIDNQRLFDALLCSPVLTRMAVLPAVCVPFPFLAQCQKKLQGSRLVYGAQDVSAEKSGAFTGEVAASMIAEFGAHYVIVGHSERRMYHGESDAKVLAKTLRVLDVGMTPIVCVGETLAERDCGDTGLVVSCQLNAVLDMLSPEQAARIVVAYEPVWAIGTGYAATSAQAQEVHAHLRGLLRAKGEAVAQVRVLYGGSMRSDNAAELFAMEDVDGGLIGGAALKSEDFLAICEAGLLF